MVVSVSKSVSYGGGTGSPYQIVSPISYSFKFLGSDSSQQFEVVTGFNAKDWWRALGGISGDGATLVAWSETDTNVDGNFAAKGLGSFFYGNGGGPMFSIQGGGETDLYTNYLIAKPGGPSENGKLGATGDVELAAGSNQKIVFTVNGAVMGKAASAYNGTSSDRWWEFGSDGDSGYARLEVAGSAGSIPAFIRTKGDGVLNFWCGLGGMLTLSPTAGAETLVNSFLMRASRTTITPQFIVSGEAGCGLEFQVPGNLSLQADKVSIPTALGNYVDDVAAAAGGVALGQLYRHGNAVMVRVA